MIRTLFARGVVVPLLGAVAGPLVYFAYNGLVFGGIAPVSGMVKQAMSHRKWEAGGGYSLARNFQDMLQIPLFDYRVLLTALGVCALVLLVWWCSRRSSNPKDRLLLAFLVGMASLATCHLAQFAYAILFLHPTLARSLWYYVPGYLMLALIVPVHCYVLIYFVRRFVKSQWPKTAAVLLPGLVLVGLIVLIPAAGFTAPFRYVDMHSRSFPSDEKLLTFMNYMNTLVMNRVLPDDSVVGSWDAGVIGYFSRFPTVNLDGLVNSYGYFRALQLRPRVYRQKHGSVYGITHFANLVKLPHHADNLIFESSYVYLYKTGRPKQKFHFRLWSADLEEASLGKLDPAAWFWSRMNPHFHYRSEGVGLVVDGRLVQAFAKGCEPERRQDDVFLFLWEGRGSIRWQPWLGANRNQLGMCASFFILPRNVIHPVRIETLPQPDDLSHD